MLHIVLPEGSKYGTHKRVAVAAMTWANSQLGNLYPKIAIGHSRHRSIAVLGNDIRDGDAIALSDELSEIEIGQVRQAYSFVPIILLVSTLPVPPPRGVRVLVITPLAAASPRLRGHIEPDAPDGEVPGGPRFSGGVPE